MAARGNPKRALAILDRLDAEEARRKKGLAEPKRTHRPSPSKMKKK